MDNVERLRRDHSRSLVMGVVNVTPDSFASASLVDDEAVDVEVVHVEAAVELAQFMWDLGADVIDIGGESTRPHAQRVTEDTELNRVVPVVHELTRRGIVTSIDTMRASVAQAAVKAGARLVNDVSGGLVDDAMLGTVAGLGCGYVAMHWRAPSEDMYAAATYRDVAEEVSDELSARLEACLAAGIKSDLIVLDPGIGFSKLPEHNWDLLKRLDRIRALGYPLLVGASRKRFIGELLADEHGPRPPQGRDTATAAVSALLAARGVWGLRVHEVQATIDAVKVAAAMTSRGGR
jgi:dihydropteroate synthase